MSLVLHSYRLLLVIMMLSCC